ncbi:MAG: hypothetical protein IJU76_15270 [Desulfovibrionaceae bacterium]|nr:hypothetical protein [Desulfovibrionaceae bacterium]
MDTDSASLYLYLFFHFIIGDLSRRVFTLLCFSQLLSLLYLQNLHILMKAPLFLYLLTAFFLLFALDLDFLRKGSFLSSSGSSRQKSAARKVFAASPPQKIIIQKEKSEYTSDIASPYGLPIRRPEVGTEIIDFHFPLAVDILLLPIFIFYIPEGGEKYALRFYVFF